MMNKLALVLCTLSLFQIGCRCNDNNGDLKVTNNTQINGSKILFILPPFIMGSHYPPLGMLASGLSKKGHEIHTFGNALSKDIPYVADFKATHALWYELTNAEEITQHIEVLTSDAVKNGVGLAGYKMMLGMTKMMSKDCRDLFSHSDLLKQLQSERYDLLVTNLFFPCDALVARFLDIPFVAFTSSREYPYFRSSIFGFPSELSYVPEGFVGLTDKMTFVERVENALLRFINRFIFPTLSLADYKEIQREQHIDEDTDLLDVMGKASLWISYSDLSLDFPQPTMPNYVRSGGMALKKALPLQQELEDFVRDSGEHGVIIFSLGSMIGSLGDDHTTDMIARAFSRLQQRVIWRHTGTQPKHLGNNTMISKWLPQNDLLGHPKTRLFIGHGGLNGVYEALYHAVPMILIPLVAPDQLDSAARVVSKGMGLQLDLKGVTEDNFYDAVTEVLNDHRYLEKVSHYSAILRDLPPAQDRAVFWIEHVLKFGGDHLRAHVFELNFIQYYLIDVAAFFLLITVVVIAAFRFTCKLLCRSNKKKVD